MFLIFWTMKRFEMKYGHLPPTGPVDPAPCQKLRFFACTVCLWYLWTAQCVSLYVCDICVLRHLCTTQCTAQCVQKFSHDKCFMILGWQSNPLCWIFFTCILIDAYPDIWLDPRSSARCGRLWWAQERVGAIHLEFGMSGTKTQILEFWFYKGAAGINTSDVTLFRAELELLPMVGNNKHLIFLYVGGRQ